MGLRAGLGTEATGNIFASTGDRIPVARPSSLWTDILLTELPQLRFWTRYQREKTFPLWKLQLASSFNSQPLRFSL
jgi:hypothetical protein